MNCKDMELRDWFAAQMDRDEYGELAFRNLSLKAKEALAGSRPTEPAHTVPEPIRIQWQVDMIAWELRVRAQVRFIFADAMMLARATSERTSA